MESLYEMTNQFEELFNSYEAIADMQFAPDGEGGYLDDDGNPVDPAAVREEMAEAWFDTLDGMELEIQEKAESVALYIKKLNYEIKAIKAEKSGLDARLKSKEKSCKNMLEYLKNCLEAAKLKKIETPRAAISIRNNPESVEIADEKSFIGWAQDNNDDLLRYKDPEVNKTAVKQLLKAGEEVPFAKLIRTQSLNIK